MSDPVESAVLRTVAELEGDNWVLGRPWQAVQKALDDRDTEDMTLRVTHINGQPQMVTADYKPNRLNVEVVNNLIVAVRGRG